MASCSFSQLSKICFRKEKMHKKISQMNVNKNPTNKLNICLRMEDHSELYVLLKWLLWKVFVAANSVCSHFCAAEFQEPFWKAFPIEAGKLSMGIQANTFPSSVVTAVKEEGEEKLWGYFRDTSLYSFISIGIIGQIWKRA